MHPQISQLLHRCALLGAVTLLASCASGRESRLAKHEEIFNRLEPAQQELVRGGRVQEGMNQDAVYLAWGSPAKRTRGSKDGKSYESWLYKEYVPRVSHRIGFGYYGGIGIRGRHCHGGLHHSRYDSWDFYGGPEIEYVPRPSAVVHFQDGLVTSWEEQDGA